MQHERTSQLLGSRATRGRGGNPFRTQLRYKIAAGAAVLVIGLGLAVGSLAYLKLYQLVIDNAGRSIETQTTLAAQHASGRINSIVSTLGTLADNPAVSSAAGDPSARSAHIEPLLQGFTNIRGVPVRTFLIGADGTTILSTAANEAIPVADEHVSRGLADSAGVAWVDDRGDRRALTVLLPLRHAAGGLAYSFDLDDVLEKGHDDSVHAFLPGNFSVELLQYDGAGGRGHDGHSDGDGHLHRIVRLAIDAPLDTLGLALSASVPRTLFTEPLGDLTTFAVLTAVVCIVIAVALAYVVGNHISRPIRRLDDAIGEVAYAGRLDLVVEPQGDDETARLCNSFNRMVDRLRRDIAQRLQAEHAVRQSEERFRDFAGCASDWLWETDAEGRFTYFSGRFREVLGYEPAEMIGSRRSDLAVGGAEPRDIERLDAAVRHQEPFRDLEYALRGKDGSLHVVVISGVPVFDGDGSFQGYRGTGSDVTRERAAQEALRANEERLKSVFDNAMDGIFVHDGRGRILQVNAAACASLQYTEAELCTLTIPEIEVSVDEPTLHRLWQAPDDLPPLLEGRHRRKDGTEFPVEIRLGGFGCGDERRFVALVRDVSEREEAIDELRRSEEQFRTLIDHSAVGIFIHRGGRLLHANAAMARMLGYASVEVLFALDDVFELYHPDERPRIQRYAEARRNGEQVTSTYETRGIRKDGTEVVVESSIAIVPWDGGEAIGVNLLDITEQRQTQAALHQAQKMEAVGQLTGGVAHDFNNLLTVILGNLEMIAARTQELEDVQLTRWTSTARRAARRGADLTQRLLAFSRRQVLEPTIVKPNDAVTGMVEMLSRTLGEHVELSTHLAADLANIYVDAAQFESAILNLAVNARDAMPDGGHLMIETANRELDEAYCATRADVIPGHYVMIAVSDTGEGMPQEVVERAFEPFFTTKELGKGTGLGLSMVYGFVKQSEGDASIYSAPGQGTTVKLYFPCRAGQAAVQEDGEAWRRDAAGHETILVVEDDEQVRETAVGMLESLGYEVLTAESGPIGLKVLDTHPEVDLLFTDIVMPGGMTGLDLALEARRGRNDIKVLYTSGYAEGALRVSGDVLADAVWLAKPYTVRHLAQKVRAALSHESERP